MLRHIIGVAFLLSVSATIGLPSTGSAASAQVSSNTSDRSSARKVAMSDTATVRERNRGWIDYLWGSDKTHRTSRKHKSRAKAQAKSEDEAATPPTSTPRDGKIEAHGRPASTQSDGASVQRRHARTRDMTGSISRTSTLRALINEMVVKGHIRRVSSDEVRLEVGAIVPLSIRLRPLPASVVKLKPAWRGYEFFVSGKEIAIVQPTTSKIVELVRYTE